MTNSLLNSIVDSLNEIPFGIRWICKQIKGFAKKKFPQSSETTLSSLVGAFFMLRYINPAIITPEAYLLIESSPGKNPRRTLTLIAKLLQNLVNQATATKEPYMAQLNEFIEEHKERMVQFLADICDVPDFYGNLEIEQYLALTKKDISLEITLNELVSLHSLLIKYQEKIASEKQKDPLLDLLSKLGAAPSAVQRNENQTISLQLVNLYVTDNILGSKERKQSELTECEAIYQGLKSFMVQLVRSMDFGVEYLMREGLLNCLFEAMKGKDLQDEKERALVMKCRKAVDHLRYLEMKGMISKSDGFSALLMEIEEGVQTIDQQVMKVKSEIESLGHVKKILEDHHAFLKMQIESYSDYLSNVRSSLTNEQSFSITTNVSQAKSKLLSSKQSHAQLEKEGIIEESTVPEIRRSNVLFAWSCSEPGCFSLLMYYCKGSHSNSNASAAAVMESTFKLDDLLARMKEGSKRMELEECCVTVNVAKTLQVVNKLFLKK